MMKTLKEYLEKQINEQLNQVVLSGKRTGEGPSLIKVRPVEIKGRILYQEMCIRDRLLSVQWKDAEENI